jgi:ketosteroid isomerase-like protein
MSTEMPNKGKEENNIKTVERIYQFFYRKGLQSVLNLLADDVEFFVHESEDIIPSAGPRKGRQGAAEYFKEAFAAVETLELKMNEMFGAGCKFFVFPFEKQGK